MKLTRKELGAIRSEIARALELVCDKFDCNVTLGKFHNKDNYLTFSVTVTRRLAIGDLYVGKAFVDDWNLHAEKHGLHKNWLGKRFKSHNVEHVVVGFNRRARTQPVLTKTEGSSKIYRWRVSTIKRAFSPARIP